MANYFGTEGNDNFKGGEVKDTYWFSASIGGNDTIDDAGGKDQLAWDSSAAGNIYVDVSRSGSSNVDMKIRIYQEGTLKQTLSVKNQFTTSKTTDVSINSNAKAPTTAIEVLYLSEADAFFNIINGLIGTDSNDFIVGTAANNTLSGDAGSDVMFGGAGRDKLSGGDGHDVLDGGAGKDALNGGKGDDEYWINELTGGSDTISDTGGSDQLAWLSSLSDDIYVDVSRGGTNNTSLLVRVFQEGVLKQTTTVLQQFSTTKANDTIISSISKAPSTAIEGLYLVNNDAYFNIINGLTGSKSEDLIVGTAAANTLAGNAGSDMMFGSAGDDILNGGEGYDLLDGGAGNDTLNGGNGDDELIGGLGNDILRGGAGSDIFKFDMALNISTNLDKITDFATNTDKLVLDDDVFTKLAGTKADVELESRYFSSVGRPTDSNDYFYFKNSTLYYDPDGNGSGVAKAVVKLVGVDSISASDILIIA